MDSSIKRIRPKDYELSVVQDNLADVLQQVLDYLNRQASDKASAQAELAPLLQQLRGPGTPQSFQKPALIVHGDPSNSGNESVIIGDPVSASAAQASAHVVVYGNLVVRPPSGGGLALVPSGPGALLYTSNIGNDFPTSSIDEIGNIWSRNTISATNIVSSTGFRASIYMGGYWTTTYSAGYMGACMHPVRNQSNGTLGETPSQRPVSTSGSILAIIVNQAGSIGGTTSVLVYKNYQPWIPSTPVGSGQSPYAPLTYPKGRYTFVRNDVITIYLVTNASGNTQLTCHLDVEYGA